jgi:hypothetical protein
MIKILITLIDIDLKNFRVITSKLKDRIIRSNHIIFNKIHPKNNKNRKKLIFHNSIWKMELILADLSKFLHN